MRKYKILFTDHTPFIGGAQVALLRHLRYLNRSIFKPFIVCSDSVPSIIEKFRSANAKVYIIDFLKLKSFSLLSLLRFIKSTSEIYKIIARENIDLVVSNTERTSYPSLLAAKLLRRKFILWVRDYEYRHFLFSILSTFTDDVIFVSHSLKNYYQNRKGKVVYVGTDITLGCHSRANGNLYDGYGCIDPRIREDDNDIRPIKIGFAGRLVTWKGAQVLIEAGKILKESGFLPNGWRIVIAGSGGGQEGSNEEELHQLIRTYNLEGEVQFIGFRENLSDFYQSLSVFVHPSIKDEPFATVIVEAMAHGLPVVASNVGGTPEIINDEVNGFLFPSGDAKNLADHLKRLVVNKQLRETVGEKARQTILSGFTEGLITRKMEEAYLMTLKK